MRVACVDACVGVTDEVPELEAGFSGARDGGCDGSRGGRVTVGCLDWVDAGFEGLGEPVCR